MTTIKKQEAPAQEARHRRGQPAARERIALADEGSFVAVDQLLRHQAHAMGRGTRRPPSDGASARTQEGASALAACGGIFLRKVRAYWRGS